MGRQLQELNGHLVPEVREIAADPSRLGVLASLDEPGDRPDIDFERLTRTAAALFKTEIAVVALVGEDRQWIRGAFGIADAPGLDDFTFSANVIANRTADALVARHPVDDPRFAQSAFLQGNPHIQFFAGAPVVASGQPVGALMLFGSSVCEDQDPAVVDQLMNLAGMASTLLTLKSEARVRARTAAALVKEEWRHALTLEAGKVGSWIWDVQTNEITCNDMFRRMYGLPETGRVTLGDVLEATSADHRATLTKLMNQSFVNGRDFDAEALVVSSNKWLNLRGRVYQRDADGRPVIVMGASIDVSESKKSADHTRLLLRELNHRVKNTLAMIQSVARQTSRQNPDPKNFTDAFTGRLRTISDAHVLLADRDWLGVDLDEVLASQWGEDFRSSPNRAVVHGDNVTLPADHALGLGLILHELTTNALRYGAWSSGVGSVSLDWEIKQEPVRGLSLNWRESGGPPVEAPKEYGLGAKLIERSLAKVLGSEVNLSFDPGGVAARIWLPMSGEPI